MKSPDAILILPHLKVQNANIISSPLTWGFPAVTAVLGFVHALERKLSQHYEIKLGGTGIICHRFMPQVFQSRPGGDTVFCLTRNPLQKDGATPAFVEEGRAHLEISLVVQVAGASCTEHEEAVKAMLTNILQTVYSLRFAGGSILPETQPGAKPIQLINWPDTDEEMQKLTKARLRRLLPGFALISREQLLAERTQQLQLINPQATALDALLEFSSLNFEVDSVAENTLWKISQKRGWVVPIPIGYKALSDLYAPGTVLNVRDTDHPFRFVENIYSLGQWLSPHRIRYLNDIFWHYQIDSTKGIYRCINESNV
ncbi:MAG: csy2 1 [Gammaproteobacteria bacterium]|nr:csy2 1 [Gammaproteobacteria bacterium]